MTALHSATESSRGSRRPELGLDQGRRLGRLGAVLGLRLGDVRAGLDVGREHLSWGEPGFTPPTAGWLRCVPLSRVEKLPRERAARRGASQASAGTLETRLVDYGAIHGRRRDPLPGDPTGPTTPLRRHRHRACRDRRRRGRLRSGPLLDRRPWRGTRGRGGDLDQARPPRIAPSRQWRLRAPRGGALRASSGRARLSRGRLVAHRGRPGMGNAWATACATASSSAAPQASSGGAQIW